jgi:hypothetical protein
MSDPVLAPEASFDYGEDADLERTEKLEIMDKLTKEAEEMASLEEKITNQEKALADLKADYKKLSEESIPTLMGNLKLDEIKTENGFKVEIIKTMRASIPAKDEQKKQKALEWLIEHKFENLIKEQVKIEFGKGESKFSKKFKGDLKKRKHKLRWSAAETVHPKTLSAFIDEQMQAGKQIPMDIFQAAYVKKASITLPKK